MYCSMCLITLAGRTNLFRHWGFEPEEALMRALGSSLRYSSQIYVAIGQKPIS